MHTLAPGQVRYTRTRTGQRGNVQASSAEITVCFGGTAQGAGPLAVQPLCGGPLATPAQQVCTDQAFTAGAEMLARPCVLFMDLGSV